VNAVVAMHFTDHAGFLRVGPHTGKKLRQGGKVSYVINSWYQPKMADFHIPVVVSVTPVSLCSTTLLVRSPERSTYML